MGKYILTTTSGFNAARSLRNYEGACANIHGHNFKLISEVETTEPDDKGLVVDFYDIEKAMDNIANTFDHHYLNEITPFDKINPTNENLAKYFFEQLSQAINSEIAKVISFSVWESEEAGVTYRV